MCFGACVHWTCSLDARMFVCVFLYFLFNVYVFVLLVQNRKVVVMLYIWYTRYLLCSHFLFYWFTNKWVIWINHHPRGDFHILFLHETHFKFKSKNEFETHWCHDCKKRLHIFIMVHGSRQVIGLWRAYINNINHILPVLM